MTTIFNDDDEFLELNDVLNRKKMVRSIASLLLFCCCCCCCWSSRWWWKHLAIFIHRVKFEDFSFFFRYKKFYMEWKRFVFFHLFHGFHSLSLSLFSLVKKRKKWLFIATESNIVFLLWWWWWWCRCRWQYKRF